MCRITVVLQTLNLSNLGSNPSASAITQLLQRNIGSCMKDKELIVYIIYAVILAAIVPIMLILYHYFMPWYYCQYYLVCL